MTTERCERCDREECEVAAASESIEDALERRPLNEQPWSELNRRLHDAEISCVPVDWRTRARDAEARADGLVSEVDAMRLHAEGLADSLSVAERERDVAAQRAGHAEALLSVLADEFDKAARDKLDRGGMRVPYQGDFSGVTISTAIRMRWWAKEIREAIGTVQP